MTTYTRIPEGEQASISLNPQHTISRISKYTYGGFTEYVPPRLVPSPQPGMHTRRAIH